MKTQTTYSMLVKSKEKGRDLFEGAVYAMIALCSVAIAAQGALQIESFRLPETTTLKPATTLVAKAAPDQPTRG